MRFLSCLGLATLAACSHAIFPNNPVSTFPAVGMCGDWNGTTFTQWGSGLAVAPGWILTARHVGGTHFFVNGNYYPVLQKFYHAGTSNADLALWKMASPVPIYMPIAYPTFAALQGQMGTLVGWGNTANQGTNSWAWQANTFGTKRLAVNAIDQYFPSVTVNFGSYTRTSDYVQFDLDDPAGINPQNTMGGNAIPGEGGISDKDSGCPWFIFEDGQYKVVAVSSIIGFYTGSGVTSNYQYGAWGAGTFLTNYKSWIQSTAPELGTMTASASAIFPEGVLLAGGVSQISAADGSVVSVRSRNLYDQDLDQPVGLRVSLSTAVVFPTKLDITVTARTLGGGCAGRVWIRNWATNAFELIDSYTLSGSFNTRTLTDVPVANRVRASDGRIEVRTSHNNFAIDSETIDAEFDLVRVIVKT